MSKKFLYILSSLIFLFAFSTQIIATDYPAFKQIVFLGDSLTDDGNLYRHTAYLIPAMPYYKGRFTNGYTWADYFSYTLYSQYNIPSENYAVGGATAILHNPLKGYFPVSADMELGDYELNDALVNKDNTLYAIWFGANDYLKGSDDVDSDTTTVVNEITSLVDKLMVHKNAEFLIIGLPNLAFTPGARIHQLKVVYQQLSTMHNQKLHEAILKLRIKYPNTKIVEFSFIDHPVLEQMVESAAYRDQINKKYGTDLNDTVNACIDMVWHTPPVTADIQASLLKAETMNKLKLDATTSNDQVISMIENSPSLTQAYRIGQAYEQGNSVCANPNQHIFWDDIHPTTVAHKILSSMILDQLMNG